MVLDFLVIFQILAKIRKFDEPVRSGGDHIWLGDLVPHLSTK